MNLLCDPFSWEVFVFVFVGVVVILIMVYLYKNDKKMLVFFVVGRPGAGKGTQCAKLDKIYPNLVSLSTGQILRQMVKEKKTERAIEVCTSNKIILWFKSLSFMFLVIYLRHDYYHVFFVFKLLY